jgi:hypothetical protein
MYFMGRHLIGGAGLFFSYAENLCADSGRSLPPLSRNI